jgi:hypothetical protein
MRRSSGIIGDWEIQGYPVSVKLSGYFGDDWEIQGYPVSSVAILGMILSESGYPGFSGFLGLTG